MVVVTLGLAGMSIYLYIEKDSAKAVVDAKVGEAVAVARADKLAEGQQEFDDYLAQKTRTFESSSNFGSVKFEYPKEWSVYNDIDGGKDTSTYTAYFSPGVIAPVVKEHAFLHALEVRIYKATFDTVRDEYKHQIEDGLVKIEDFVLTNEYALSENKSGIKGQKVTGYILYKNEINYGTMVQFEIRDKILQLYSMQPEHSDVFSNTVLKTLRWVK